jgi:hypothetical protein
LILNDVTIRSVVPAFGGAGRWQAIKKIRRRIVARVAQPAMVALRVEVPFDRERFPPEATQPWLVALLLPRHFFFLLAIFGEFINRQSET